ncbi:hypothetical protein NUW58_g7965 [Xylaria curta]|uniref:Uncharacterized protein n=1 Tax=Xylaria curta TaxID=42375 RepID=A0ACC1NER9_9PEZI|nr:hypothetical protein NUW58_g7965 [Xylaria curta]
MQFSFTTILAALAMATIAEAQASCEYIEALGGACNGYYPVRLGHGFDTIERSEHVNLLELIHLFWICIIYGSVLAYPYPSAIDAIVYATKKLNSFEDHFFYA